MQHGEPRCRKVLILAAVLVLAAAAQGLAGWTERQPFTASSGQTIHYYLFRPEAADKGKRYPLVIWLHGGLKSNGKGGPNMPTGAFYKDEYQATHPCFVLRPVAVKGKNWVSPRGAGTGSHTLPEKPSPSVAALMELLDKVTAAHPVDPKRVHVVGASMGGYGVWDVVTRYPTRFASAIPICGGGDPMQAKCLKSLRIWIFHSGDDRIVPVRGSRTMFEALAQACGEEPRVREDEKKVLRSAAGGRIRYTEYNSGGHNAWDRALTTPGLIEWVFGR